MTFIARQKLNFILTWSFQAGGISQMRCVALCAAGSFKQPAEESESAVKDNCKHGFTEEKL